MADKIPNMVATVAKRRGRPRKLAPGTAVFQFNLPPDLRAEIQDVGTRGDTDLAGTVRELLREAVAARRPRRR